MGTSFREIRFQPKTKATNILTDNSVIVRPECYGNIFCSLKVVWGSILETLSNTELIIINSVVESVSFHYVFLFSCTQFMKV